MAVLSYDHPPAGETVFPSFGHTAYHRSYDRCDVCGLFVARLPADLRALYGEEYVDATYGDRLRKTFDRIMQLPPGRSDNIQRVAGVNAFMASRWQTHPRTSASEKRVLDVGSGLCVFLARMKESGWHGVALDPDARAVTHARDVVGVDAVCGDFMSVSPSSKFDLITFNKVLEHVPDPVQMLERSRAFLAEGGVVYVELPDGESALREGPGREEFFIEHLWVFSAASVCLLALRSGMTVHQLTRLREPSGKFTLRAFMTNSMGA